MYSRGIKKFVNAPEAASRDDFLARYVLKMPSQVAEQFYFPLCARREIRLSCLAGRDLILFAVPKKKRCAQTGSRRNHTTCGMGHWRSWIQRYEIDGREPFKTQRGRHQVVQQVNVFQMQLVLEHRDINQPRQVF